MDMYYCLKDRLMCKECKCNLKYSGLIGYGVYRAVCIACGREYEVSLKVKLR